MKIKSLHFGNCSSIMKGTIKEYKLVMIMYNFLDFNQQFGYAFDYGMNNGPAFGMDLNSFDPYDLPSTLAPVTDIFGTTRMVNPFYVDIMSGLPLDVFPSYNNSYAHEMNQSKLEESSTLNHEMNAAVDKYHDAIRLGDYEEAAKWESIANSKQDDLYNLWDTPRYFSGPAKAPGL